MRGDGTRRNRAPQGELLCVSFPTAGRPIECVGSVCWLRSRDQSLRGEVGEDYRQVLGFVE